MRQSTTRGNVPTILGTILQHLHNQRDADNTEDYSVDTAKLIAHILCHYASANRSIMNKKQFCQFVLTYSLNKSIKKFGVKGKQAAYKEMWQLHAILIFTPVRVESLTAQERKRAMESLIFLIEKRDC